MKINYKYEPNVNILIRESLYNNILSLVNSTELEITLVLEVKRIDKYTFEIINKFIPPQWNEPTETKTIDSKYPQWCIEQIKQGHKLNGHMHSHPHMSVTPSGYDNTFFNELAKETNSFQLRFIINQKGFITVDVIDQENNYIAEECKLNIICKDFLVVIDDTNIAILAEDKTLEDFSKEGKLAVNNKFEAIVISDLLKISKNQIIPTKTEEYKPVRKNETDEGYKTPSYFCTSPSYTHNDRKKNINNSNISPNTFIDDDFYGYSEDEINIAKEMHMTQEELDEYLMEMEEYNNGYSK